MEIIPEFDPYRIITESHLYLFSCDDLTWNHLVSNLTLPESIVMLTLIRDCLNQYAGISAVYNEMDGFVFRGHATKAWVACTPDIVAWS